MQSATRKCHKPKRDSQNQSSIPPVCKVAEKTSVMLVQSQPAPKRQQRGDCRDPQSDVVHGHRGDRLIALLKTFPGIKVANGQE